MKTIQDWLSAYAESHQNKTNKLIHWICVPAIFFSIIGLFWAIPVPWKETLPFLNVATLVYVLVLSFYFRLSKPLFVGFVFIGFVMFYGAYTIEHSGLILWRFSLAVFVIAWIFQFIGHKLEGKKPSFFDDLKFLLIGPAWVMSFVFDKLNISYKLDTVMSIVVEEPVVVSSVNAKVVAKQRAFFNTGATKSIAYRIEQLKKLESVILQNEQAIFDALWKDLHKNAFEAYGTEVSIVLAEINHFIKHLSSWSSPQKVSTPPFHAIGKSYIQYEPYGVVFVMGPWNYPFQLALAPLVGAIGAGNTCILKPSENTPNVLAIIKKIVNENFSPEYAYVVTGEAGRSMIQERFDYIFFTGGGTTGQYVYEQAAKNMIPVTLELGGKSPCIIEDDANLEVAARRIAWGKFTNAGQTCVAPDYLLVNKRVKSKLVENLQKEIKSFFGEDPQKSADFGRIVNNRQFQRLVAYLQQGNIVVGGLTDEADKYIAPTLMDGIDADSPIMKEEIFGPILPILEYTRLEDAIQFVNERSKPLALYVFTESVVRAKQVLSQTSSGNACVNEVVMHVGQPNLPFGGVGSSGMGGYHGKYSFETFSHRKGILDKSTKVDLKIRYAPYKASALPLVKKLLKWLG